MEKGRKTKEYCRISRISGILSGGKERSDFRKGVFRSSLKIYQNLGSVVFGNAEVAALLQCSETTATEHIKRLNETLGLLKPVKGKGKGKYRFSDDLAP